MHEPMDAATLPAIIEMVEHLSTHDPERELFGAREHAYHLRAPLSAKRLRALETKTGVELPDDYRAFLQHAGDGGAGPHHGLLPLDVPCQRAFLAGEFAFTEAAPDEPEGDAQGSGTVVLADMGCGYCSLLVVRGPARGQVWADLRGGGGGLVPTHASFKDWYAEWLQATSEGLELEPPLPHERCGLPNAIEAWLARWAQREAPKRKRTKFTAADRRAALGTIGDGAIAFRSSTTDRFFDEDDPIRMCVRCHRMASELVAEGALEWRMFTPGGPCRAEREAGGGQRGRR